MAQRRKRSPQSRARRMMNVRTVTAAVIVMALVAGFVVRLADLQVVQADSLNAAADGRRGVTQTIYGTRGDIVDTQGEVLAGTVDRWDLTVSPRFVHDLEPGVDSVDEVLTVGDALTAIGEITGGDPVELQQRLDAERASNPDSDYLKLLSGLTAEQYEAVRDLGIPYVYLRRHPERVYPDGEVAGNLVGFMGTDEPLAGLELSQDECLAASDGEQVYDVGRDGTAIPGSVVTDEPATDGGTLQLTIDADVQYQVQQEITQQAAALGAESGTAIVMGVDGSVVAMAQTPSVDPNSPADTPAEYRGATSFTNALEPGSIFKSVTMAAMIDLGLVTPETELTVPWTYYGENGIRVRDAHSHPTMQWTAAGALVNSSNSGMVQMGESLDRDDLYGYLDGFGFGDQTAVGWPGEQAVPLAADPTALDTQTQANMMFGQGIAVTPIQMASAYQALANGGMHEPVRLVEGCTQADGTVVEPELPAGEQVVSEETAQTMVNMMEYVVTDYGYDTFPIPGYRVAAKTGTAQVAYSDGSGYDPNSMIITTAGMFPADDPQYVVYVQFDKPATERTSAGAIPTFHDIVSLLIREYEIPPSTEPVPDIPLTWGTTE